MTKPAWSAAFAVLTLGFIVPALAEEVPDSALLTVVETAAPLPPGQYVWDEEPALGAVSILISIPEQRAYVYRGATLIAVSAVSTGKDSKPTPTGLFPILQKAQVHRSSKYANAPMPYMQRLTWDGVAIHAGHNPGFPASHGCIRVPGAFAKTLFAATEMGAIVEIVDAPVFGAAPVPRQDDVTSADADFVPPVSLDTGYWGPDYSIPARIAAPATNGAPATSSRLTAASSFSAP